MSLDRPAFIIAFAADLQGCGTHRIAIPLASLVEAGIVDGRIDMAVWPAETAVTAAPDTIVWQRQVEDSQIATMQKYRELMPDTLFVYELDDYLGEIPKASFHAGFMPPDLPKNISRALALCDRVTTTTEPLAEWLRSLGGKDVRVVGNAMPAARLTSKDRKFTGRLRIGFAGGVSHDGDLELIKDAVLEIGDEVDWVFMGIKPKWAPLYAEFREGVQPAAYLDELAKLNLDLMLAPLEENHFNHCKSNLRLLETATIGAAVIAQRFTPYTAGSPPVFGYATTPEQWTTAIRKFIEASPAQRKHSAEALHSWVIRHHTLELRLKDRIAAWVKEDKPWRPQQAKDRREPFVLSCATPEGAVELGKMRTHPSLLSACDAARELGTDVLWMRPGTRLSKRSWDKIRLALLEDPTYASVIPIASDGPNAFPVIGSWSPVSDTAADAIETALDEVTHGRLLAQPATTGPVILLSRTALAMGGFPDVEGCEGNEEVAIFEWGLRLALRGWKHCQAAGAFAASMQPPMQSSQKVGMRFNARSFMTNIQVPQEVLSVEDRAKVELKLLRHQWNGPRPGSPGFDASYPVWAALKDAIQPNVALVNAVEYPGTIRFCHYGTDFNDVRANATENDWLVLTEENTTLKPRTRSTFEKACLEASQDVKVVYSDHETSFGGEQIFPEFKSCLDRELLLATDYITPICAVRLSWLDGELPQNRAGLYAIVLQTALTRGTEAFVHIPEVLATIDGTKAPEGAALEALERQLTVREQLGACVTVTAHRVLQGCLVVRRNWRAYRPEGTGVPRITVVIPTLGGGRLIQPCVNTLRQHTSYPNLEILVVQNGERREPELGEAVNDPRVKVVFWEKPAEGFNWSALNNWAVREHATGDFICFMNDDVLTASMDGDWLDLMLGHAILPDVGAVGARLIHPMGVIQHIGVVAHNGVAGHLHKMLPNGHPGQNGLAVLTHESRAVTGACMLVARSKFDEVGGFDETFSMNYNDTDFCLRLAEKGYRNIVEMGAELMHPEGTTRSGPDALHQMMQLQRDNVHFAMRWSSPDPYWNPNLAMGFVQNGMMIQGLNKDVLAWQDELPDPSKPRIAIINDTQGLGSRALADMRRGAIPFLFDASAFTIMLVSPKPLNTPTWDIRRTEAFAEALKEMGISRVVLCSLVGRQGAVPPVDFLQGLARLNIPVEIAPTEVALIMPWLDPDWKQGSEPFGHVDVEGWKAALNMFEPAVWPTLMNEEAA